MITLKERILCYVNYISIKLLKNKLSATLSLFPHLVIVRGVDRQRGKLGSFLLPFWRPYRLLTHQETSQPLASMYTWPGLTWWPSLIHSGRGRATYMSSEASKPSWSSLPSAKSRFNAAATLGSPEALPPFLAGFPRLHPPYTHPSTDQTQSRELTRGSGSNFS